VIAVPLCSGAAAGRRVDVSCRLFKYGQECVFGYTGWGSAGGEDLTLGHMDKAGLMTSALTARV
jgi:hypothetical protein